jgi:hypothetical protein
MNIETAVKPTKFSNIVRKAPEGFYTRKPMWFGTGNSGKTYMITNNGTWYSTYINYKNTIVGYRLDEVSEALKQL